MQKQVKTFEVFWTVKNFMTGTVRAQNVEQAKELIKKNGLPQNAEFCDNISKPNTKVVWDSLEFEEVEDW